MTIRSHFVPQFYLRNFGDKLFFYDKTDQSIKQSEPQNLALMKNFYGPPDKKKSSQIETAMSQLEGDANSAISKIIMTENYSDLSDKHKAAIYSFVALQYLRTQEARSRITEVVKNVINEIAKHMGVTDWEVKVTDDGKTSMHLDIMKYFAPIAAVIGHMGIIIFVNDTKVPFWTSDNPVVLSNELEQFPWGNLGIASKGIEVHLPLTPRLEICFYDPTTYYDLPEKASVDEEGVIRQNYLQTINSTRFLFSNTNEFYMANEYLKSYPDAKKEDRRRLGSGIHELKPEDFQGKEFYKKPEFWIDPSEVDKIRDEIEKHGKHSK
jgi:hypothetical protein